MEGFVSETLTDFLVDLASDADRMQAFLANPAQMLDQSTLSAEEKAAVLTRNSSEIRRAMGALSAAESLQNFMTVPPKKKKKKKKTGTKKKKKGGKKKK